jgi:hypothetical protein
MQDEVTKHTQKIYKTVRDPDHTFAEKVRDIIVEVCIIVFAVTLSIWLHSWSEHRDDQKRANEFLTGLKHDLTADIKLLEENKTVAVNINSNFIFLSSFKKQAATPGDTTINHHLYFSTRVTRPQIGRYDGFKTSGKLETIENDSLKQNILTYYQQTIPDLVDGEDYTNSLQLRILDLQIDKDERMPIRDFVTSIKVKSLLELGTENFGVNIQRYNCALAQAKKIIAEIDREQQ